MSSVLDEVVRLSGLSPIFAKTVVSRAIRRAGVEPGSMQQGDIARVLPELRRALSVYVGEATAEARAREIEEGACRR